MDIDGYTYCTYYLLCSVDQGPEAFARPTLREVSLSCQLFQKPRPPQKVTSGGACSGNLYEVSSGVVGIGSRMYEVGPTLGFEFGTAAR